MSGRTARVVVVISAGQEWQAARVRYPQAAVEQGPYGEVFALRPEAAAPEVVFVHGGWGKIAAAASAQWAIDRFGPALLVNLGTCGGFEGAIARDTVMLVERTLVYDIIEQMGDPEAALAHYSTRLNLSWLREPFPMAVRRGLLVSADRDLLPEEIPWLQERFGAIAGDWESASIAYVCARNGVPCLILRGVSDLVGPGGGEAYDGSVALFTERAALVMGGLLDALPGWLSCAASLWADALPDRLSAN